MNFDNLRTLSPVNLSLIDDKHKISIFKVNVKLSLVLRQGGF